MPLAIRSTSFNTNSCPTHIAGDLLLAVSWGVSAGGYSNDFNVISNFGTVWYYDNFQVAYRVATDGNTGAPWGYYLGNSGYGYGSRVYAIQGALTSNPIAEIVNSSTITATSFTIPSIAMDQGRNLRFTFVQGVASGGNPDIIYEGQFALTADGGLSNELRDYYFGIWTGGVGPITASSPYNWYKRYATLSILPALPASGFFTMF